MSHVSWSLLRRSRWAEHRRWRWRGTRLRPRGRDAAAWFQHGGSRPAVGRRADVRARRRALRGRLARGCGGRPRGRRRVNATPRARSRWRTSIAGSRRCWTWRRSIVIHDMAVNPATEHLFFSVSRGRGGDAPPPSSARRCGRAVGGAARQRPLLEARAERRAARNGQDAVGRQLAQHGHHRSRVHGGELLIAGLSNDAFSSTLRRARFPFGGGARATTLEIFHTSHGKYETAAPIETFLPYQREGPAGTAGGIRLRAAGGVHDVRAQRLEARQGRTLAELGGGNRPQDMIAFERDGKRFVLIANSNRGVMRMSAADIDRSEPSRRLRRATRPSSARHTCRSRCPA